MKELILIQSELKAPKSQFNKFGGYNYRNCEDILEAVKPILKKYNCFIVLEDELVVVEGWHYVKATATITNSEGISVKASAYAREEESKKGMDASQLTGSTSSYARKYALNALLLIDDTKDADTTNTHGKEEKKETKPQSAPTPAPQPQAPAQPKPSVPAEMVGVTIDAVLYLVNNAKDGKELTSIYRKYKTTFQGEDGERFINAIKVSPVNPNRKK